VALKQKDWGYEIPLLLAGVIWGSSFVSGKVGVEHMDPVLFSMLRYSMATLCILPILIFFKRFDRSQLRNPVLIGISILNAMAMVLQNVGMTMTTATNTVLLIDINVVYIAILAVFVLKEKLTKMVMFGLVLGLIGVFIISTEGDISHLGGGTFLGNAMALTAGVLWSIYVVYLTRTLKSGADLASATFSIIILTTLVLVPFTILYRPDLTVDPMGLGMAAYTGVICTTLAFILYSIGLRGLGATTTSVILLIEIVFGMLFAILLLSEMPTAATWVGGAFILMAVILISFKKKEEKKEREGASMDQE
jgi:drug/metabolite transporter (DMT)-like permease